MEYDDGTLAEQGDIVQVPMPNEPAADCIVMLGDTQEHRAIDQNFRCSLAEKNLLKADAVVVEWIAENPSVHDNPAHAPVGDYMFTRLYGCVLIPR